MSKTLHRHHIYKIRALEARNRQLRDELERQIHGNGRPWGQWIESEPTQTTLRLEGKTLRLPRDEVYFNNIYQVAVRRRHIDDPCTGWADYHKRELVWLSIKRRDGAAVRDWRHFQRIKNELVGPEAEGIELYPADSRLTDGANQYHLWVLPAGKWPVGWEGRIVGDFGVDLVQQRPIERSKEIDASRSAEIGSEQKREAA